ncbi:hypothetical protein ABZ612_07350 [Streptomyces avermitilis]|uniref:hypothetical protein n=1 Tax=Streptomyces avermitilis TaxID=33903 RepID=UPI0034117085
MKSLLSASPTLWFLFLFNVVVAAVAPFVVDGARGVATGVGMGAVSLGAGSALHPAPGGRDCPELPGSARRFQVLRSG